MEYKVNVHFDGSVMVNITDHLNPTDARLLAEKIALARIVATTENTDAPEDEAFEEYAGMCSKDAEAMAEIDWDDAGVSGVGGEWTSEIAVLPLSDGKMQVELGIAFGDDNGSWTTDFVDIPRNTPEHAIEEVAIGQYRTENPGEYAHLWLYHYSYDIVEDDELE